jgi:hypothetical protein
MIDFVKNNYLKFLGTGPSFHFEMDQLPLRKNFYLECCLAAEEIYANKQGQLYVMYSGGVDSENTLSVFLSLRMNVIPVIIKFKNNYNNHDLTYAFDFCESNNISPLVIDFDFDQFVISGKILEIADEMKTSTYHRPATAYAIGQLDGTVLAGDGEFYIKKYENGVWNIEIDQHELSVYNFMKKQGIIGTTHFNCYTPQMVAAWMTDPTMEDLANNRVPGKLGSHSSKYIIYSRHSPVKFKKRPKITGYEVIEKSPIFQHPNIKEITEMNKIYNGTISIPYSNFVSNYIKI